MLPVLLFFLPLFHMKSLSKILLYPKILALDTMNLAETKSMRHALIQLQWNDATATIILTPPNINKSLLWKVISSAQLLKRILEFSSLDGVYEFRIVTN